MIDMSLEACLLLGGKSCLSSGKWTVQQAAELSVAAPTIEAALDARFLSGAKDERVAASDIFEKKGLKPPTAAEVRHVPSATLAAVSAQHTCPRRGSGCDLIENLAIFHSVCMSNDSFGVLACNRRIRCANVGYAKGLQVRSKRILKNSICVQAPDS